LKLKKSAVYAKVLFEEDSSLDFLKKLKAYIKIFTEDLSVFSFFNSPLISFEEKTGVLDQALKQAPALLKSFFKVLLKNKSFFLLSEIQENFQELWNDKNKLCPALVFRSQALTEREKADLKDSLKNFFNKKIVLQEKEDKSLIAGLKVFAGGYIFKGNTSHFLKKFKQSGGF